MKEKVSIVIPVYNAEKTIIRCLDSINNQTYQNLEIIVINDGSTDDTQRIVSEYVNRNNKEQRFVFIKQPNKGVSATRNTGIKTATGTYIAFADADDYMALDGIEHMVEKIKKTDAVMVIANHIRHEEDKDIFFKTNLPEILTTDDAISALYKKNIRAGCCGKLYRVNWLNDSGLFFPEDRYGEDIYHLFYAVISGEKIAWLNEPVYHVVDTKNSICNIYSTKFLYLIDTMEEMKDKLHEKGYWDKHKIEYREYYLSHIRYLLNYGVRFEKKDFLSIVLKRNLYPYGRIKIDWSNGFLSIADGILFNINKSLYVAVKLKRRERRCM